MAGKVMSKRKMEKRIKKIEAEECRYNQIKTPTNIIFNILLTVLSLICVIPLIFVIIISFTDEASLSMNGYRFIPEKLSFYAYEYIISAGEANMPKETIKMAIVVISTLPIIFAYPFFQRYFVNGLTVGAVKE